MTRMKSSPKPTSGRGGGGIGSKATAKVTIYNAGYPAKQINPRGVSQIGSSIGNHVTERGRTLTRGVEPVRGGSLGPLGSVPLGNQVSVATQCGPGGSREVMRSGSQGVQGPVAGKAPAPTADILSEYGPDSPNVRGRR
jgi:hypothetical protein